MKVLNEANRKVENQTKMSNIIPANERAVEKMIVPNEKSRTLKSKNDTDLSSLLKRKTWGRIGLVVRASDSGSGDPGAILGRVGVLFP